MRVCMYVWFIVFVCSLHGFAHSLTLMHTDSVRHAKAQACKVTLTHAKTDTQTYQGTKTLLGDQDKFEHGCACLAMYFMAIHGFVWFHIKRYITTILF